MNAKRVVSALVTMALASWVITPAAHGAGLDDVSNWAAYDPGDYGVSDDHDGFHGGMFDSRYV